MQKLVAAALLQLLVLPSDAARVSVDLSFGWRFRLGLGSAAGCNASSFPISLNDKQVNGLSQANGVTSVAGCIAAACQQQADLYQYCPGGLACGGQSCWIGSWTGATNNQAGWQSSRQNASGPLPTPPESQPGYPDAAWDRVDLPHDFEVLGAYSQNANGGEGYLPYNVSYYRKHFNVPASFNGTRVELYVDGALSASRWWLNGVALANGVTFTSGYTAIPLRLDTTPGFVAGGDNILVAFVDGTKKTGWWYEGAGLYRRVYLTSTPLAGSVATHGVAAPSNVTGAITPHDPNSPAAGLTAPGAVFPSAIVRNDANTASTLEVTFTLISAAGGIAASATSAAQSVPAHGNATFRVPSLPVPIAELWSVPRPYLYMLRTTVAVGGGGAVLDTINASIGIRAAVWDANRGFFLNGEHVKMRGACNHENFGAIGSALSPRVDLLRIQQLRGVGGNAWRTSHNAPETFLLDIADRLGVLIMDENRVFATQDNCPNCNSGIPVYAGNPVQDFADLVARDKLHSSVIWWSFCNEAGCGDGRDNTALAFRAAGYAQDGSRPVGANMGWLSPTNRCPMSDALDVWGCSHCSAGTVASFHSARPNQPVVMSECCSCEGQRGEDADQPHDSSVFYSEEQSQCMESQSQASNGVDYNAGTFIWTMHDYKGEPDRWPHVESSFGSFDVGGIPKALSFWLRAWWLSYVAPSDAGRPPLSASSTAVTAHIVESWAPSGSGSKTRKLTVYSNAPFVRLSVNGVTVDGPTAMPLFSRVYFNTVTYVAGNVTVEALGSATGPVLASHTRFSWGAPAAIVLSLDAPSVTTGTGSAVYLDGTDVALLRATVVDAAGVHVSDSSVNITFTVSSGPGLVLGTVSGNPANHDPAAAPWKPAYHGIVRAIVRANIVAVGDTTLLAAVNTDAGSSAACAKILSQGSAPPTSMIVTASAPGLPSASMTINLSVSPADEVMAVAAGSVGSAFISE